MTLKRYMVNPKTEDEKIEGLKKFVKNKNKQYLIVIVIVFVLVSVRSYFTKDLDDRCFKYISVATGLIGTVLVAVSTFNLTAKNIIALATTKRAFHIERAKSILSAKLLGAIGTILLIATILTQNSR